MNTSNWLIVKQTAHTQRRGDRHTVIVMCFQEAKATHGKIYPVWTAARLTNFTERWWEQLAALPLHSTTHEILTQSSPEILDKLCRGRTWERVPTSTERNHHSRSLVCGFTYQASGDCGLRKKQALISLHSKYSANPRIGARRTTRSEHF